VAEAVPRPFRPPGTAAHAAWMENSGTLDEALARLHRRGPERLGRLTNHAPMAVEALVARGRADAVHGWLDRYAHKLEDLPARHTPVTPATWPEALGDPRRTVDWTDFFTARLAEAPWRAVLTRWWPVLLPGMYGGSTHPVIRVGHAVRALTAAERAAGTPVHAGARLTELAHGLGYWAARHTPVRLAAHPLPPDTGAAEGLEAVEPVDRPEGGFGDRLGRLRTLPAPPAGSGRPLDDLSAVVRAAVARYARHGRNDPVMLVHAATAPAAVLRILPELPPAYRGSGLHAGWTAAAAVTAMYAGGAGPGAEAEARRVPDADELVDRAVAHGDAHVVKFTDTALDVGDAMALGAALRALEWNEPL
jgi:hypothetical protein